MWWKVLTRDFLTLFWSQLLNIVKNHFFGWKNADITKFIAVSASMQPFFKSNIFFWFRTKFQVLNIILNFLPHCKSRTLKARIRLSKNYFIIIITTRFVWSSFWNFVPSIVLAVRRTFSFLVSVKIAYNVIST